MKRITALVAALLLFKNAAYAVVVGYSRSVSGGFTCSSTPYASAVTNTSGYNVGSATILFYQGIIVNSGQTTRILCSIDFFIRAITGDISTKNFYVKVYSSSWVLKGTSVGVSGSSITASSWQNFVFSTPVSVAEGDRVLLTMGEVDASNYLSISYQTSDIDGGYAHYARLYENGTIQSEVTTTDLAYRAYAWE